MGSGMTDGAGTGMKHESGQGMLKAVPRGKLGIGSLL